MGETSSGRLEVSAKFQQHHVGPTCWTRAASISKKVAQTNCVNGKPQRKSWSRREKMERELVPQTVA